MIFAQLHAFVRARANHDGPDLANVLVAEVTPRVASFGTSWPPPSIATRSVQVATHSSQKTPLPAMNFRTRCCDLKQNRHSLAAGSVSSRPRRPFEADPLIHAVPRMTLDPLSLACTRPGLSQSLSTFVENPRSRAASWTLWTHPARVQLDPLEASPA